MDVNTNYRPDLHDEDLTARIGRMLKISAACRAHAETLTDNDRATWLGCLQGEVDNAADIFYFTGSLKGLGL